MYIDHNLETDRLKAVNRFLNLNISREKELQDIVRLAASICESPVALITLIEKDIQHFKFKIGTDLSENLRKNSFCDHLIENQEVMVVNDLTKDKRFLQNPLVNGDSHMRFYAGAPLTTHEGKNVGSICVLDQEPKELNQHQKDMLAILSRQVINILEFELSLNLLKEQYNEAENTANKLRSFFESSPASHALLDKNYEVITYNKTLAAFISQMYGVKLHIGMKATNYMNRAYIRNFIRNFNRAADGETVVSEREIVHPIAGKHWFRFVYNPAYDRSGNIIGISWSATDINESKQHEQKILEQNNALRRIAYVQSHDFRKPVASILGLLNVMKLEGNSVELHNECMHMIEQAAHELDNTIKDIVYSTEPVLNQTNNMNLNGRRLLMAI